MSRAWSAWALFVVIAALFSCTQGADNARPLPQPAESAAGIVATAPGPGPLAEPAAAPQGIALAAPAGLAAQLTQNGSGRRRASYDAQQLMRFAEDFDAGLPHQLVSATAPGASFTADFDGAAPSPAGLAYAMYPFTIPGYAGEALLRYEWITAPSQPGHIWFALANWGANRWDFYRGNAAGSIQLEEMGQYFIFGGTLLAAVVATGSEAVVLSSVHIGGEPPSASPSASTLAGMVPFSIEIDASSSQDSDGSIVDYSWDPEGDGSFISTGLDPHFTASFSEAGEFPMTLRVTDDSGLHDESSMDIVALDVVTLSYGAPDRQESAARVMISNGQLTIAGTRDIVGFSDTFIARIPPARFFTRFAFSWGGTQDEALNDAVQAAGGDIYTCGWSESFGLAGRDALLQKWSRDGEALWMRAIELAPNSLELNSLILHGTHIYACGSFTTDSELSFGLVMKFDLEGNLVWVRTLLSGESCVYRDLVFHDTVGPGTPLLKLCGSYAAGPADDTDIMYAEYDASGTLMAFKVFQHEGDDVANGICLDDSALPKTFLCGELSDNGRSAFMCQPGATPALFRDGGGFDLVGQDAAAPHFILRRFSGVDAEDFVIVSLDEALGFAYRRIGGDGLSLNRVSTMGLSGGYLMVAGGQTEDLPETKSYQPQQFSVGAPWADISPSQATPPVLQLAALGETFALTDLGFNRESGDGDCLVYLDSLEQP